MIIFRFENSNRRELFYWGSRFLCAIIQVYLNVTGEIAMAALNEIRTYQFNETGLEEVRASRYGKNWPVVYLIHDEENLYIGETTSAATRMENLSK